MNPAYSRENCKAHSRCTKRRARGQGHRGSGKALILRLRSEWYTASSYAKAESKAVELLRFRLACDDPHRGPTLDKPRLTADLNGSPNHRVRQSLPPKRRGDLASAQSVRHGGRRQAEITRRAGRVLRWATGEPDAG